MIIGSILVHFRVKNMQINGFVFNSLGDLIAEPKNPTMEILKKSMKELNSKGETIKASYIKHRIETDTDAKKRTAISNESYGSDFPENEIIEMNNERYRIIENYGVYGLVVSLSDGSFYSKFYWVYNNEKAILTN